MTTIAYNHKDKEVASDGRLTGGNYIYKEDAIKRIESDGEHWFIAGEDAGIKDFVSTFKNNEDAPKNIGNIALLVDKNKDVYLLSVVDGVYKKALCDHNEAIGSGCDWALAAMDFGKTARESVEYASTRDCKTGGTIRVFDIETGKEKPL